MLCVCLSVCDVCRPIVAKQCVFPKKTRLKKQTGNGIRELEWSRDRRRHVTLKSHCRDHDMHALSTITRKRLEIDTWLQITTDRKWPMANRMVTCWMMSRDPETVRDVINNLATIASYYSLLKGSKVGYSSASLSSCQTWHRQDCVKSTVTRGVQSQGNRAM